MQQKIIYVSYRLQSFKSMAKASDGHPANDLKTKPKSHQTILLLVYFRNRTNSIHLLFHPNEPKLLVVFLQSNQTNSFNRNELVSNYYVKFFPTSLMAQLLAWGPHIVQATLICTEQLLVLLSHPQKKFSQFRYARFYFQGSTLDVGPTCTSSHIVLHRVPTSLLSRLKKNSINFDKISQCKREVLFSGSGP